MSEQKRSHSPKTSKEKFDKKYKIIFIGDSGVGKTSILDRFSTEDGNFKLNKNSLSTIGVVSKFMTVKSQGKLVQLQFYDTAGQERYRSMAKSYYKKANAVILMYDISVASSLENLGIWLKELNTNESDNITKILLGNKSDLEENREVKFEEGKKYAEDKDIPFYEVSAYDGKNIDKAFITLCKEIIKNDPFKDQSNFSDEENEEGHSHRKTLDKPNHEPDKKGCKC